MPWILVFRPLGVVLALPWLGLGAPLVAVAIALAFALALNADVHAALTLGAALSELAHGLVLGLAAAGALWAAKLAGRIGDAGAELPGAPLERLYQATALAVFAVVDGPLLLGRSLLGSYAAVPIGQSVALPSAALGALPRSAVDLAAPLIAAVLAASLVRIAAARVWNQSHSHGGRILQPVLVVLVALSASVSLVTAVSRALAP